MSYLSVTELTHSFGDRDLYRDASFELYKGEHMGVVGQNGSGKSTLLRILLGDIAPTGGRVAWQNRLEIGHIDQHAALDAGLSIQDYLHTAYAALYETERRMIALYAGMADGTADERDLRAAARCQEALDQADFYAIDHRIAQVAAGLGLPAIGMDRPLRSLSGGQRAKVILAKLLLAQPDILLLDEPTNFLDAEHVDWLSGYLAGFPGSFMIVSHDHDFLDRVTTCILDIEFLDIKKYHGKYSDFARQKAQQRADYARRYAAQEREAHRLEDYIARNRTRTATARIAQSRQKALDRMERLPPPSLLPQPLLSFAEAPPLAQTALTTDGLLVGYDVPLLPRLDLRVEATQKVVVTGFNGIGKSTLLKTLVGALPALGGAHAFHPAARVGYFEQDLRWPDGARTPLQIIGEAYPDLTPRQVRRALARAGVTAEHAMQPIASLSGGEQNKVKLCRLLMSPHNFLVLDEPTNHLDVETKEALRLAIAAFPGAVMLVSHEPAFYLDWVDRVIPIERMLSAR